MKTTHPRRKRNGRTRKVNFRPQQPKAKTVPAEGAASDAEPEIYLKVTNGNLQTNTREGVSDTLNLRMLTGALAHVMARNPKTPETLKAIQTSLAVALNETEVDGSAHKEPSRIILPENYRSG